MQGASALRPRLSDHRRGNPGGRVIAKCANPEYNCAFRYLHEGRLFAFRVAESCSQTTQYRWLCSSSAPDLTVRLHPQLGIQVVKRSCFEKQSCTRRNTFEWSGRVLLQSVRAVYWDERLGSNPHSRRKRAPRSPCRPQGCCPKAVNTFRVSLIPFGRTRAPE
jgi:hypothetical protein